MPFVYRNVQKKETVLSCLDSYYASLLDSTDSFNNLDDAATSTNEEKVNEKQSTVVDDDVTMDAEQTADEILTKLAMEIDMESISKFNISRNFIWEGTKRALSRKSFSPNNKVSVKFTDDVGNSEGAIDMGGPMKEYFTLVMQWMVSSKLFSGPDHAKFLSCNASSVEQNEYYYAGLIIAMSLVNGGPGPQCLDSKMFEVLVHGQESIVVDADDVYDKELRDSLKSLHNAPAAAAAMEMLDDEKLMTVLNLAGTLVPIKTTQDSKRIAALTSKWYVIGRATVSLEAFENGLSALAVLDAIRSHPKAFQSSFVYSPSNLTSDTLDDLFKVRDSPVGSNKAVIESLVVSRWRDYLQDIEEGNEPVQLSDVLFFISGCKVLPPRNIYPTIEFLHNNEEWGEKSRFPKANTCSDILRLPVVHTTYEAFKGDMNFAIQNGRGFGLP